MLGLDIIGAGESLAPYTILVHIRSIDPTKLRQTVSAAASSWGATIPGAIQMVDSAPELTLEVALPVLQAELTKIGINADVTSTKTPPKGKTPGHEMEVVLGVGAAIGIVLAFAGRTLYHLITKGKVR